MITSIVMTLIWTVFMSIYMVFCYFVILLNFLFWNHRAFSKYVFDNGAKYSPKEFMESYGTMVQRIWNTCR